MTTPVMLTADRLRHAARMSAIFPPDPQTGYRPADPLRVLIPGEGQATREALAPRRLSDPATTRPARSP